MKTTTNQFATICSYQGSYFTKYFGSLPCEVTKTKLYTKVLGRNMLDKEILAEYKPSEVTTGEIFNFLKTADKEWYIFYSRDKDNVLWAVDARWDGDGWRVSAGSVGDSGGWGAGFRVASRDSFDSKPSDTKTSDPLSLESRLKSLEDWKEKVEKIIRV